jgi:dihydroorotase
VGYDADFTLIDRKAQREITNKWIASKCGYTPFDGMKVIGWPVQTILKGTIVMQDDQVIQPHQGEGIGFNK